MIDSAACKEKIDYFSLVSTHVEQWTRCLIAGVTCKRNFAVTIYNSYFCILLNHILLCTVSPTYNLFFDMSHYRIIKSNKNLPVYPTWCMPGVGKCLINLEDQKQNRYLKICHFEWSHLKQRLMEIDFYWISIHLIICCQNKLESWLMILCKHSFEDFLSSSNLHA